MSSKKKHKEILECYISKNKNVVIDALSYIYIDTYKLEFKCI